MPRELKDIQFNSGYNQCEARMSILKNETVASDLNDYTEIDLSQIKSNSFVYVDNGSEPSKIKVAALLGERDGVQVDWDEEDPESLAFIKNKPDIKLQEDIVSAYNVGGVKAGDVFKKGTPIQDVIMRIFTIAESVLIRFGVLNSLDNINPADLEDYPTNVQTALSNGIRFYNITLKNQYYVLCIPKDDNLLVDGVFQSGYKLSTKVKEITDFQGKKWVVYYPSVPATGTYTFMYKLRREE